MSTDRGNFWKEHLLSVTGVPGERAKAAPRGRCGSLGKDERGLCCVIRACSLSFPVDTEHRLCTGSPAGCLRCSQVGVLSLGEQVDETKL